MLTRKFEKNGGCELSCGTPVVIHGLENRVVPDPSADRAIVNSGLTQADNLSNRVGVAEAASLYTGGPPQTLKIDPLF